MTRAYGHESGQREARSLAPYGFRMSFRFPGRPWGRRNCKPRKAKGPWPWAWRFIKFIVWHWGLSLKKKKDKYTMQTKNSVTLLTRRRTLLCRLPRRAAEARAERSSTAEGGIVISMPMAMRIGPVG